MTDASSPRSSLLDHLRALLRDGGDHNRVVLGRGDDYVLFIGGRGEDGIQCEVAAPAAATASLGGRGFARQRGRRNLVRRHDAIDVDGPELAALADEALAILAEVHGIAGDDLTITASAGDRPQARNPELLRAMKVLAMSREMSARQRVYHEVMRATLLLALAIAGDAREDDDDEPHVFEHLQGYPVIGVFSDWDALRLWEPRGWPVRALPGHQILAMARARRVGSLLINPKGDVGGELLMNEIAALAEQAHRYAGA